MKPKKCEGSFKRSREWLLGVEESFFVAYSSNNRARLCRSIKLLGKVQGTYEDDLQEISTIAAFKFDRLLLQHVAPTEYVGVPV